MLYTREIIIHADRGFESFYYSRSKWTINSEKKCNKWESGEQGGGKWRFRDITGDLCTDCMSCQWRLGTVSTYALSGQNNIHYTTSPLGSYWNQIRKKIAGNCSARKSPPYPPLLLVHLHYCTHRLVVGVETTVIWFSLFAVPNIHVFSFSYDCLSIELKFNWTKIQKKEYSVDPRFILILIDLIVVVVGVFFKS